MHDNDAFVLLYSIFKYVDGPRALLVCRKGRCIDALYLGCAQKSGELGRGWPKLRVCNAKYAAEGPIDAKIW